MELLQTQRILMTMTLMVSYFEYQSIYCYICSPHLFTEEKIISSSNFGIDFLFITASPGTGDGKSIDDEHPNNYNSINSEDVSFVEKKRVFRQNGIVLISHYVKHNVFHISQET